MLPETVAMLVCPNCNSSHLVLDCFQRGNAHEVITGALWCEPCRSWYPIINGVLEFLTGKLVYPEVRNEFWERYKSRLENLGLKPSVGIIDIKDSEKAQTQQQEHSDWYAENAHQSYSEYERMPFWAAVDSLAFDEWIRLIYPNAIVMDIGCAQGRSTFKLINLPIQIVAFDVSRKLVHQAQERYLAGQYNAKVSFIVADASHPPFINACFDNILVYGVLHHLPDPGATCQEIVRLLRPGGTYFGCENNKTIFRRVFDAFQRLNPLWYEEAGPEPLMSESDFQRWFSGTGMHLVSETRVFIPPHLVNRLGFERGRKWLDLTDRGARRLPIVKSSGGLIMVKATKPT